MSGAVKRDLRTYIRQITSPNENFEYGYPHSNAFLQFYLKLERCKLHNAARHPTKCDVINDIKLRLGHTRVTHSYLLQGEELPQCVGCDAPFTVRHFLLECGDFAQVKNNCFHVDNMKELFQDIHIDSIMTFLRQINLFNKI